LPAGCGFVHETDGEGCYAFAQQLRSEPRAGDLVCIDPALGITEFSLRNRNSGRASYGQEGSALRIFLIEDNPGDILLIQQILTATIASVEIRLAMDGEQALRMLADPGFKPDLIILDLNIPKVPGIAILAQCKPAAPIVVFSSSSNPAEIQRAKELGVREFVQKPIDFEEFDRVVKRMIQDWANPRGRLRS